MRVRDWQSRFQALVLERLHLPFAWGVNDCALFAADAVLATTGKDPAAGLRGYSTAREAATIIETNGGLLFLTNDRLGARIKTAQAQVGDIGMVDSPNGFALAVWGGSMWMVPGPDGLVMRQLDEARLVWRGECRS